MAENDVSKMKVADLKRELKVRGLRTTGNKEELVERLQSALIEGDVFDDAAISEDLLNEDEVLNDDELDEEAYLNPSSTHDEDAILKSPQGSTSSKSPETPSTSITSVNQQKKVTLKRKLVPSLTSSEDQLIESIDIGSGICSTKVVKLNDHKGESSNGTSPTDGSLRESNVIKLAEMTMKDRLELRAKKFGAAPSTDALKQARAERFGTTSHETSTTPKSVKETPAAGDDKIANEIGPDVDILKKRAERFGGSVSNVMVNIENKEKLLKRQERFGTTTSTGSVKSGAVVTPTNTDAANDYAEKAKLRAERFKISK